jgi:hypothetical protein
MIVDVNWYDDKEDIIYYQLTGAWKWEDFEKANQIGRKWMRQKPHYIGILIDLREMTVTPSLLISKVTHYINSRPENTGLGIFVTSSSFIAKVYEVVTRVYPSYLAKYQVETDFDESIKIMRKWLEEHKDIHFQIE